MKTTADIRKEFIDYFAERGHAIVPSAPLVPGNDPTLMFTNSGMVQFKDVFLGAEKPNHVRVADVQRCLRAGGKHNDLDQVGYTARHHTFFEMLGNWSFGDYFKKDAIVWSWELLTKVWGLPAEKLLATVYHDDDEAFAIWRDEIGLPEDRIIRIGDNKGAPYASDNFWQMADTGPCGPCTEIFYDHGEDVAGGPPGSPEEDGDRFIEIWNLVFMQFDRQPSGELLPLPAPCVDTGMGLERVVAVLQGVHSNYDIDLFQTLIAKVAALTGTQDLKNKSLRVIADHIRAASFLIVDGVLPSKDGRGYVLRRIIRRALRHGWMLGCEEAFFHKIVPTLVAEMGDAYPDLKTKQAFIEQQLADEEARFAQTLAQGMKLFEEVVAKGGNVIPGDEAFRLYDTYGFPVDLTADIARERGFTVDMDGFEREMEAQRERARAASNFGGGVTMPAELASKLPPTEFLGYDHIQADGLRVVALLHDDASVQEVAAGQSCVVLLDRTPFYAESGGQQGDHGVLVDTDGQRLAVDDTIKLGGQFHAHVGEVQGKPLRVGDVLAGQIDDARRQAIVLNHSATHLLHAALRDVLGTHVEQKGSLVAPDRLRFDFSHPQPVTPQEIREIERIVNEQIRGNATAEVHHMGYDEAIDFGAMALFGEKYGDEVRVLRMGAFSTELCGGTHVQRLGDIGVCRIVSEGGISAGVRRIEAMTGEGAMAWMMAREDRLLQVAHVLGGSVTDVVDKAEQWVEKHKGLERELGKLKAEAAKGAASDLASSAVDVQGIQLVAARLEGIDAKDLRESVDQLKQKLGDAVIVLASANDGKAALIAGVHGAALGKVKAGDIIKHVAAQIGGRGGGRPDMAQGGGEDGEALRQALDGMAEWLAAQIN